jgi:glyoxylase-like metal-dependent hydrolase (beta-lactamase superfamily II)
VVEFSAVAGAPGDLAVRWHAGWPSAKHDPAPAIQVHAYDEHTLILRQNKSVHYEAPFLFLLFGNDRAMLVDTGATPESEFFPLRRTVDDLVERWLANHPRPEYGLVVVHTHGHGDHVAGDGQFVWRPNTTVVGTSLADVVAYYGFTDWPDTTRVVDLGGRTIDVIPGPGHQESAVVFYDRHTGLLLTGDTVVRGRLYVVDWPAYVATIDRLLSFCAANPVTHVVGCHIEMTTTPGRDYPIGTGYQPDEPPLPMTVDHLHALRAALDDIGDRTGIHVFADFVVYRVAIHTHL